MKTKGYLKEYSHIIDIINKLLDILFIYASGLISFNLKFGSEDSLTSYYWIFLIAGLFLFLYSFRRFNLYKSWRGISIFTEVRLVIIACTIPFIILITGSFLLKISNKISREWLIEWYLLSLFIIIIFRLLLRITIRRYRKLGFNKRNICLISYGDSGNYIFNLIKNKPEFGFDIIGVFSNLEKPFPGCSRQGTIKDSIAWLKNETIDQIWIATPVDKISLLKNYLNELKYKTIDIKYIPDLKSLNLINHSITELGSIPIVNLSVSPMGEGFNRIIKRLEDIIFGMTILLLISPIILVVAAIIKITSPGSVFYRQTRVGFNNKPFTILKFRSMPINVEKSTGAVWATSGENRATKFGSFLRKTSLDELPQFINVVKGNMSIVGPRPERPEFVEQFKKEIPSYMKKHMVKAGITGWAQINGWRGNTDLKKRIEHDIYYIENWSILFDIKIILLTIFTGFINKNAY
jgi:putative colanic acid biosysnthesis UDP-glucose lipid carrier transferase